MRKPENGGAALQTAPSAPESQREHVFILAVPPHLADAASELVAALVEASADPERRTRDREIASAAWRRGRERRRLAAGARAE
ncbi:MAG: hypothetical protein FJ291_13680 [Planctomycetes bacterium]|nr:hypothetical protein [Planctomycetota bacterium]